MNPAGIFDTFMFDFRLEEYMEVSLAALMGNLLTCSTERASWRLCYSLFLYLSTWQMSRSFCSTRTSQECEHTIFRHHEALQRSMLSLLSRGSLRTWLHWRFCDCYSHFHPGRMSNMQLISEIALPRPESHAAVWWGGHHSRTESSSILPFVSDPAQWSPCSSLPGRGVVIGVMDIQLNIGACRG